jgi:V8-like Glu-specific endopeptidase
MLQANALTVLLTGVFVALIAVPAVSDAQLHQEALANPVGLEVKGPFVNRGDGVLWQKEFRVPGSNYLRLVFDMIVSPPGLSYSLLLRSGEDRLLGRYTAADFAKEPVFYTEVLFSDTVRVELEGPAPLTDFSFRIATLLHQVDLHGRTSALANVPVWRNVLDLNGVPEPTASLVTRTREAVAKIYMGNGAVCTAFLVAPSALLTNFHCLNESTEYQRTRTQSVVSCGDIEAEFDFNRDPAPGSVVKSRCQRVLAFDPAVDVAVLAVDPGRIASGKTTRRPLSFAPRAATEGEELVVIHHPGGLAKQYSFGCRAFPVNKHVVEHDCSTIPGSSGAALISPDGTVIGVHYAGPYDESMTVGEINLAIRRGQIFRNKARPAPAVLDRIKSVVP